MKKMVLPILIILLVLGLFYYKKDKAPLNPDLKTYKSSSTGISFNFPTKLTVSSTKDEVLIHHEVPFVHHDYCDFKGEGTTTIDTLTDFNLKMRVQNKKFG
jgi:hypothetical protein